MSLALLKIGLIGGAVCGVVATATATPLFAGRGWTEVLLVAKSQNDNVKLYLQPKVDPQTGKVNERMPKLYELKAQYKGKEVKEKLMLCSPSQNKDQYFLLKLINDGHWTENTLSGQGKSCESAVDYENIFEDPISIRFLDGSSSQHLMPPKSIFLTGCTIENLSESSFQGADKNKPSVSITCSKDKWDRGATEVKIVDQGLFYI